MLLCQTIPVDITIYNDKLLILTFRINIHPQQKIVLNWPQRAFVFLNSGEINVALAVILRRLNFRYSKERTKESFYAGERSFASL